MDHYIRRLAQKADPSIVLVQSPGNDVTATRDKNSDIVKSLVNLLFTCVAEVSCNFRKFVVPFKEKNGGHKKGSSVEQKSSTTFDVGLLLVKPVPKGAFEVNIFCQ